MLGSSGLWAVNALSSCSSLALIITLMLYSLQENRKAAKNHGAAKAAIQVSFSSRVEGDNAESRVSGLGCSCSLATVLPLVSMSPSLNPSHAILCAAARRGCCSYTGISAGGTCTVPLPGWVSKSAGVPMTTAVADTHLLWAV